MAESSYKLNTHPPKYSFLEITLSCSESLASTHTMDFREFTSYTPFTPAVHLPLYSDVRYECTIMYLSDRRSIYLPAPTLVLMRMLTTACLNYAMDWHSFTSIHSDITAQSIVRPYFTYKTWKRMVIRIGGSYGFCASWRGGSYDFKAIARGGHILFWPGLPLAPDPPSGGNNERSPISMSFFSEVMDRTTVVLGILVLFFFVFGVVF